RGELKRLLHGRADLLAQRAGLRGERPFLHSVAAQARVPNADVGEGPGSDVEVCEPGGSATRAPEQGVQSLREAGKVSAALFSQEPFDVHDYLVGGRAVPEAVRNGQEEIAVARDAERQIAAERLAEVRLIPLRNRHLNALLHRHFRARTRVPAPGR